MTALEGYKTYIVAGCYILAVLLESNGILTAETFDSVKEILVASGVITLSAKANRAIGRM